ncbi:MAG TPA: NADH-quinone oxidoreductase subunit C [Intrasporangium sp.]|uniref:NADH-quinone oxidoreductase subunit C n=1 Tax=Intrasporangium sp. TaxID=1925024 RepID=UPI002D779FE5|nr:NADH-quinone oxidoreductase subunit C [Intrasporangium sp.]HET7398863.1 NADH-quinone oxidoreductase subunit C [Intrasporangium sp.]
MTPADQGGGSPEKASAEQTHSTGLTPTELERAQAAQGTAGEPLVVGVRRGMFGSSDGADTSGYGGLVAPIVVAGPAQRPYGGWFDQLVDDLERGLVGGSASIAEAVDSVVVDHGELTIHVNRQHLPAVARVLRDDPSLRFELCLGVSGVHYPERTGAELHAVYHLLSITHGSKRVRLEVSCPDSDPHIPSIVSTYPAADWHERETWDMFGIVFDGHPALTRILMPDDWPGHPQRKDYPLGGIPVEYKGATVPPPDQRRSYT